MTALTQNPPFMTSLELVDVINSMREEGKAELRHDTFLTKVQKVLGATHQNFLASYKDSTGRALKCYHLPKREASLMVMSESYAVQAKVYDRMTELEGRQSALINPTKLSRLQLIELAMQAEQERLELEHKVEALEPKAEAFEMISASSDAMTYTEASKVLGIKRKDLVALLHAEGWHYRQNKSWVAYDRFIKNGCLQYKEGKYTDENSGLECVKPYCHITQKGLARLAEKIAGRAVV